MYVVYNEGITLRIPISATNLGVVRPTSETKLSKEAIEELLSIAEQCEVLCQTNQEKSGENYPQKPKTKLLSNSKKFSKR